jgi:hypothetical protein
MVLEFPLVLILLVLELFWFPFSRIFFFGFGVYIFVDLFYLLGCSILVYILDYLCSLNSFQFLVDLCWIFLYI